MKRHGARKNLAPGVQRPTSKPNIPALRLIIVPVCAGTDRSISVCLLTCKRCLTVAAGTVT